MMFKLLYFGGLGFTAAYVTLTNRENDCNLCVFVCAYEREY